MPLPPPDWAETHAERVFLRDHDHLSVEKMIENAVREALAKAAEVARVPCDCLGSEHGSWCQVVDVVDKIRALGAREEGT